MGIPTGPAELTPEWFDEHLGWKVDAVDAVQIGIGIGVSSTLYRVTFDGGKGPDSVPDTVVVKLVAIDPAAAFTSQVLKFYEREVQFYDKLADTAPVRTPHGYYGEVSGDGASFVAVIEDLAGNRIVDQTEQMTLEDAGRIIDAVADWHARWWNNVDGMCDTGQTVALSDPIYPAMLPGLFDEGWAKLNATPACVPGDALQAIGTRWTTAVAELLQRLSTGPETLLHGDVRTDNIMFAPDETPIFMDFQILGTGSAAYDLAYFVTQSLDVDAVGEMELFQRWITRLEANGVPADDLSDMWEQYRNAAAFCLVYPVVASRGMDFDDPRQVALANSMVHRFERAASDLDLASVLP